MKQSACLVLFGGCVLASSALAHESIAAAYVLPDEEQIWVRYDASQHGDLASRDHKYQPGWYLGAGIGSTEVSPEGSGGGYYVKDDRDWGYKVFAGRRFFPHWSAEISFVDMGEAGLDHVNPLITTDGTISYQIPTISGSYHVFGPKQPVDVFARVGLSSIINSVTGENVTYEKQTPVQLNLGAGVQWRFADDWFARIEFDSFDNDASMIALSVARYFEPHKKHGSVSQSTCQAFTGTIESIQFEVDSADLTASSELALQEMAKRLIESAAIELEIQAHTDHTASDDYNIDLSNRRAQAIKTFLVNEGVSAARLTAIGFGEAKPVASNETADGRAQNRRVEFKVIDARVCQRF